MYSSPAHQPVAAETMHLDVALAKELRALLVGRVCVLGVGNRDRRDDAVGSMTAERLGSETRAMVLDAGAVPENFLEKAARFHPDTILLIDAVDFGGVWGELRVMTPERVASGGLSTHAVSLRMAAQFLEARTGARIALLAMQPAEVKEGTGLSAEAGRALERLVHVLSTVLG